MSCAICEKRREKRFCPAIHGRICPLCCGEQREVTLDCPSECVHLQQAREHEKPRELSELDQSSLFPQVEIPQQFLYEQEALLLGFSFALAKSADADRTLTDKDLLAALLSVARSYETLVNSGLHYEQPPTGAAQHAVAAELQSMLKGYREEETKNLGYSRLRDSDVLRALVFLLRIGFSRTSGRPRSRAYADFLLAQFPKKQSSVIASPNDVSTLVQG